MVRWREIQEGDGEESEERMAISSCIMSFLFYFVPAVSECR